MSDLKNKPKEEVSGLIKETESNEDQNTEETVDSPMSAKAEPEIEISEEEILQGKLNEMNDRFVRLYAEFDNYKKRTSTERFDLIKTAGKDVILSLLPVLDDFDRALQVMEDAQDIKAIKDGVELVKHKFNKILEQRGLKEMNCLGNEFNSDFEEAITSIPASDKMKGKVVDVLEKGYLLNDKVISFAKVIVGS